MFRLTSLPRACRHGLRSIASISPCAMLPLVPVAAVASPPRAAIGHQAEGGPGWYDSSWELVRGLQIAEVLDLEAELALWIEACLNQGPATGPA